MLRLCLRLQTEAQQFTQIHGTLEALEEFIENLWLCVRFMFLFQCHEQGCSKSGSAPDGTPYLEAAEKEDIKALLR